MSSPRRCPFRGLVPCVPAVSVSLGNSVLPRKGWGSRAPRSAVERFAGQVFPLFCRGGSLQHELVREEHSCLTHSFRREGEPSCGEAALAGYGLDASKAETRTKVPLCGLRGKRPKVISIMAGLLPECPPFPAMLVLMNPPFLPWRGGVESRCGPLFSQVPSHAPSAWARTLG